MDIELLKVIQEGQRHHSLDDDRRFSEQKELLAIAGEHMSHLRKDVTLNKETNDKILRLLEENTKKLDEFMMRANPAVKVFENLTWSGKGFLIICVAVATIAGGILGLKEIINNVK